MKKLAGKVAIVTGAASGIGAAIASIFAMEGARTVIADIDQGRSESLARKITSLDGECIHVRADVANAVGVEALVEETVERFEKVDILVSNAGLQYEKRLHETSVQEWDHVMNVNLKGMFLCCRAVIPHMLAQGRGNIIAMGSVLSKIAEPGLAAYCASKGGMLMLARSIATDYGSYGIRANCICPGYVDTPLGDIYFEKQPDPAFSRQQAGKLHLLGRIGLPMEIARCALFLASDDSSFVTGAAIDVDGGLSAKV